MEFRLLDGTFCIAKLPPGSILSQIEPTDRFFSITSDGDEISIVATEPFEHPCAKIEGDWRAIKIVGPLAFELTGVMSSFLVPLADAGISVFTISTFSTDYIFVREQSLDGALNALKRAEIRPVGLT